MRRRARPRVPHLRLVQPGAGYRRSPALSPRPEVVAAFQRGRRDAAAAGDKFPAVLDELFGSREVQRAYLAGRSRTMTAPVPLPLAVATVIVAGVCTRILDDPRPWRDNPAAFGALAGLLGVALLSAWAEPRRARALGLTSATAPVRSGNRALFIQGALQVAQFAWVKHRTGVRPRISPAAEAAALAILEFDRRRSWRRALSAPRRASR